MNRVFFIFFIFTSSFSSGLAAQIVGDEALQKLQSGEVSFLEGEFIVFLNDTVSPDFIEQTFSDLKYEISFSDIKPILISIVNSPADSTLEELKSHPDVQRFFMEPASVDSAYFKDLLEQRGLRGSNFDRAYDRLIASQTREELLFEFDYSINELRLKKIMGNFRSVAYQILQNYTRSVNVVCTPGKEQELMEEIEQLPFVESTALIGIIGN